MNKKKIENKENIEIESEKKICGHITKKGTPCKNRPEDGHIYCKLHLEDEAREADKHEEQTQNNEMDDMSFLMNAIYNRDNNFKSDNNKEEEIEDFKELSSEEDVLEEEEEVLKEEKQNQYFNIGLSLVLIALFFYGLKRVKKNA